MNKNDKFNNRLDERWAHPEIQDFYEKFNIPSQVSLDSYDLTIPYEIRKQKVNENARNYMLTNEKLPDNVTTYSINGISGNPISVHAAKPAKVKKKMPCLFYIPGGGLTLCAFTPHSFEEAEKCKAIMILPVYRTIYDFEENESGYPGTIDDLEAVYKWTIDNADELNINTDKIVLHGGSSGAHLALALAHRLKKRDYYGAMPRGIVTMGPIVDERMDYSSSKYTNIAWSGLQLHRCLKTWLGPNMNPADIPADAVPNHASKEECIGLPPTFMHVEEHDPGASSTMAYAEKLLAAGVYTEVHLWGGAAHTNLSTTKFVTEDSKYSDRFFSIYDNNILDCFKYDFRRQWLTDVSYNTGENPERR